MTNDLPRVFKCRCGDQVTVDTHGNNLRITHAGQPCDAFHLMMLQLQAELRADLHVWDEKTPGEIVE